MKKLALSVVTLALAVAQAASQHFGYAINFPHDSPLEPN